MEIPEKVINWLLDAPDPFLKYRVEKEFLSKRFTKKREEKIYTSIEKSESVQNILESMHPDGYWLHKNRTKGDFVGDGFEYRGYATTHFFLPYLAELGIKRRTKVVKKAAERYLNLQSPDGDWYRHFPCLYGYNIQTFIRLGYRNDRRIQKTIDLMMSSIRWDNGYLCYRFEKKKRKVKSCIGGSIWTLAAFAELGESYWNTPECKRLCDYFLHRNGIFKKDDHTKYVTKYIPILVFPFVPAGRFLEVLCGLSKIGCGSDPRLEKAWALLESKMDADGKFPLEKTPPSQSPWKYGKRGEPNHWITFDAYLTFKHREQNMITK